MPQKKKTANKRKVIKNNIQNKNKILYYNQFQIIAQNKFQDIKTIKIIFNMLQLCSKNHELII